MSLKNVKNIMKIGSRSKRLLICNMVTFSPETFFIRESWNDWSLENYNCHQKKFRKNVIANQQSDFSYDLSDPIIFYELYKMLKIYL